MLPFVRVGLDLLQKAGLDQKMVALSRNKFIKDLIFNYCWQHEGYDHCHERYEYLLDKLAVNHIPHSSVFKNKDILEIGSGNSIGLGYFFAKEGFSSWTGSDISRHINEKAKTSRLEYELAKRISSNDCSNIMQYIELNKKLHFTKKFNFMNLDVTEYNPSFINKFDIIISITVLEHIDKLKMGKAIKNMTEYLKLNGIMLHAVDLKDHINPMNQFGFYRYDECDWKNFTRDTIFYTNRLRTQDYLKFFKESKLTVVSCIQEKYGDIPQDTKRDFLNNYSEEDLKAGEVFFILKKTKIE